MCPATTTFPPSEHFTQRCRTSISSLGVNGRRSEETAFESGWSLRIGMGDLGDLANVAGFIWNPIFSKAFWSFVGHFYRTTFDVSQVSLNFYSTNFGFSERRYSWNLERKNKKQRHRMGKHGAKGADPTIPLHLLPFSGNLVRFHCNTNPWEPEGTCKGIPNNMSYHRCFFLSIAGRWIETSIITWKLHYEKGFKRLFQSKSQYWTCLWLIIVDISWTTRTNAEWRSGVKLKNSSKKAISAPG